MSVVYDDLQRMALAFRSVLFLLCGLGTSFYGVVTYTPDVELSWTLSVLIVTFGLGGVFLGTLELLKPRILLEPVK